MNILYVTYTTEPFKSLAKGGKCQEIKQKMACNFDRETR